MIGEWHRETWEEVVSCVIDHFEPLGFTVETHAAMGTITISHGRKAITVMNTTGSHFDAQDRLILPIFKVTPDQFSESEKRIRAEKKAARLGELRMAEEEEEAASKEV
jgi:hypothetical protein